MSKICPKMSKNMSKNVKEKAPELLKMSDSSPNLRPEREQPPGRIVLTVSFLHQLFCPLVSVGDDVTREGDNKRIFQRMSRDPWLTGSGVVRRQC